MDYMAQVGKLAVTGRPHCVSDLDNSEPFLQINGKLVSANLLCTFLKLPLVFSEKMNFRCKLLFFNIRTPILGLQLETETFMSLHLQKFNRSCVRLNVGMPFLQGLMLTLAQKTGKHILRTVISKVHGSANQVLTSIGNQ